MVSDVDEAINLEPDSTYVHNDEENGLNMNQFNSEENASNKNQNKMGKW